MKTAFLYTRVFLANILRQVFVRKNPNHGSFIVLDGGEGCGKSTIVERLKKEYPHVEFSREPGGTEYAEEIRSVMLKSPNARGANGLTQFLLVSAGRADHMARKAEDVVLSGRNFATDRSDSTSWGYQIGGQEGGYEVKKIFFAVRWAIYRKVRPDFHIILEVDPEEGARRVALRKGEYNHFDDRKRDFHLRVMRAYRVFSRLFPFEVAFVDANRSRDEVYADVKKIFESRISKR